MVNIKKFCRIKIVWHSIKKMQSTNHRIRTHEINRIYFSWFDDQIYILNNVYEGLAFGY